MKSSRLLLSLVILLLAVALPSRAADAPVITAVSPRQVPAGIPGFTLVVQGRRFDKSSVVLCNGSERNTTWVSDHMLRAAILTSDIAKRRTLHIAVQVNGDDDEARSNSVRVMVNAAAGPQPVKITTTSLATARVGAAYSAALTATGGKQPYHWTFAAGAFPGGLSLASNGLISGTLTASGNFPVTVSVQDSSPPASSTDIAAFSLSVAATVPAPSPVKITTSGLPGGQVGTLYQTQLTATGGKQPYTWTLASGPLPSGVSLAPNGLISGRPTASGNFSVTVNVQDSSSPIAWTDLAVLSISITAAPPASSPVKITILGLPGGQVGTLYQTQLTATGGKQPYHWMLAAGAFPGGLSLAANGLISGTATASGNFPVTVNVQDSSTPAASTDIAAFSLSVAATVPAPSPVKIATLSLPGGQVGTLYQTQFTATGGKQPYRWTLAAGPLPGGLSLAANGLISGTITASGNFPVTVSVQDSSTPASSTDIAAFSLSVAATVPAPSPVKITTLSLPGGQVGILYQTQLTATGGKQPYHWTLAAGAFPGGLSLASNGLISGTLTASGNFPVTVSVQDSSTPAASTDIAAFSLSVAATVPAPSPVKIATLSLPGGQVGTLYQTQFTATGGKQPYRWTLAAGPLPGGLSLAAN